MTNTKQYRIIKENPWGKVGDVYQYEEGSENYFFNNTKKTVWAFDHKIFQLTEYFEPIVEKKGRWRANFGDVFYCIDRAEIVSVCEGCGDIIDFNHKNFNYFKTESQAQAILDLKEDIAKYEMPEIGGKYYFYSGDDRSWDLFRIFGCSYTDIQDFIAGFILPITATKEQQDHRIALLKKADEVYKELLTNDK